MDDFLLGLAIRRDMTAQVIIPGASVQIVRPAEGGKARTMFNTTSLLDASETATNQPLQAHDAQSLEIEHLDISSVLYAPRCVITTCAGALAPTVAGSCMEVQAPAMLVGAKRLSSSRSDLITFEEYEAKHGPTARCKAGICANDCSTPCRHHTCTCCKKNRRVAGAAPQKAWCGPCQKREKVDGLHFVRCGHVQRVNGMEVICGAELLQESFDNHWKQHKKEYTPDAVPVLVGIACTEGRKCGACTNMRPLTYFAHQDSLISCNHCATVKSKHKRAARRSSSPDEAPSSSGNKTDSSPTPLVASTLAGDSISSPGDIHSLQEQISRSHSMFTNAVSMSGGHLPKPVDRVSTTPVDSMASQVSSASAAQAADQQRNQFSPPGLQQQTQQFVPSDQRHSQFIDTNLQQGQFLPAIALQQAQQLLPSTQQAGQQLLQAVQHYGQHASQQHHHQSHSTTQASTMIMAPDATAQGRANSLEMLLLLASNPQGW